MSSDIEHLNKTACSQAVDLMDSFNPMHRQMAGSMEQMADAVVNHLYRTLRDNETGRPQCSLVRLFRSCSVSQLPEEALTRLPENTKSHERAMTLLATRGKDARWNSRHTSVKHKAISMRPEIIRGNAPLLANLLEAMGIDFENPSLPKEGPEKGICPPLDLLHANDAMTNPLFPDKTNFVRPYDIKSVVGFGNWLSSRHFFTVFLFFNVHVKEECAAVFNGMERTVYHLLHPYECDRKIFTDS